MICININNADTECPERAVLTSGMVKAVQVAFTFSEEWADLTKIAVFSNGETQIDVPLDDEDKCFIPHEVLSIVENDVTVGVYGSRGDGGEYVAIPTEKCNIGRVVEGVNPSGEEPSEPTPTIWDDLRIRIEYIEGNTYTKAEVDKFLGEQSETLKNQDTRIEDTYTKTESNELVGAYKIVRHGKVTLSGDAIPNKTSENIYVRQITNAKNEVVFGETYENTGRWFGYVGVKNITSGNYVMMVEVDAEFNDARYDNITVNRLVRNASGEKGTDENGASVELGRLWSGKNFIVCPFTGSSEWDVQGIYMDTETTETSGLEPIKLTLRDVRLYNARTFPRSGYEPDKRKVLGKTIYDGGTVEPVNYTDSIEDAFRGDEFVYAEGSALRCCSLTDAHAWKYVIYTTLDAELTKKDDFEALSEEVGKKANAEDLTALQSVVNAKGITFNQYAEGVKIPLETGCLYYMKNENDTLHYYMNGAVMSQYTEGFGHGLVMMSSNIYQGKYQNYLAAPSISGGIFSSSAKMNGYTISTLDTDDVYAKSESGHVNVWKVKA